MNTKQRFKLSAGAGLVTMLLGALMVLAPMGVGAEEGGGNEDCPAGTFQVAKFNFQGGSYVEEGGPGPVTILEGATAEGGSWESTTPIDVVIVKGSNDAKQDVYDEATSGSFDGTGLSTPSDQQPGISNVKFCADLPTLTVSKDVVGDAGGQTFPISVTQDDVVVESDSLGDGASLPVIDPASGEYVISETLPESGWNTPTIQCDGATATGSAGGPWTVEVVDDDVDCTITNTSASSPPPEIPPPPPVPGTLTVEKVVVGLPDATAIPDSWSEIIDVDSIPTGNAVSNVSVNQGDLSDEQTLAAGTYRLDELGSDDERMALTDITCTNATGAPASSFELAEGGDLRDGVEVALAAGGDVTCVFENTYTAQQVLPEEEEPGSITIVKAVEGPAPDAWAFGFNVSDGVGRAILTDTDADATFGQLEAGQYTIAEDDNSVTTLGSIACDDPDAVSNGRTVTVDVSEGEDVTCTFTNVFPAAEVKGDVITRTLPRTGNETRNLAGVGAFMLAMGAAMVLGSKRQLARR